jgi:hypothetical protein
LQDPHQSSRNPTIGASPRQSFKNDPHESYKILIRASETSQEVQVLVRDSRMILTKVARSSSGLQDHHKRCKILVIASGMILTRVARSSSELQDPHKSYILIRASGSSQEVQVLVRASGMILRRVARSSLELQDPHESYKILVRASVSS